MYLSKNSESWCIMEYLISIIIGYLIGTSSMSYYLGKLNGFNMKEKGSGNLGASNTMVLMGWKAGILVALHDIFKAVLVVYIVSKMYPHLPDAKVFAGTACILGHIFPFYLKFKGGKGLASFVGVAMGLDWKFALILIVLMITLTIVTDYIVTATFTAMIVIPLYFGMTSSLSWGFILGIASFVMIFKHIDNIKRILNGTEVGFRRANKGVDRIK